MIKIRRSAALICALAMFGISGPAQAIVLDEQDRKFAGLSFGVGISATLDIGHNDRIEEAEVVAGIVRIKKEQNTRARVMLESHYFFLPEGCPFGLATKQCGWGPFVAIQPGTDEVIEAVSLGLMFGLRKTPDASESFNVGVGLIIDPNTRILGEGLTANGPLPAGEVDVRYQERSQKGIVIITSFSF